MTIIAMYDQAPGFPASEQRPDAQRALVGTYVVDYVGDFPTQADVDLMRNPPRTPLQEVAARFSAVGIAPGGEWQLYSAMAGMLALGAAQGRSPAQLYAENTGYRNAKDLADWYGPFSTMHNI